MSEVQYGPQQLKSIIFNHDIDMRFSVRWKRCKPDSDKDLEGSTLYLELGENFDTIRCLSSQQRVLLLPMAADSESLTGRLAGHDNRQMH